MTSFADTLTRVVRQIVRDETADWHSGTVAAVNGDGTVDVTDGDGDVLPGVRRYASTYPAPAVGDIVVVHRDSRGNRITPGPLAAAPGGWQPISLAGAWTPVGGATDPPPAARITADGTLQLSGLIKGVAINAGANATVGTLPGAVTPSYWIRGMAVSSTPQNYAAVHVNPSNGVVSFTNGSVAATAATWFQLDGVTGRAR